MNTTKEDMFNGCLIASIAHAIMTNVYPDLSYEQSWDGINYSIQNSTGLRGTITFESHYCIGAIRDDKSVIISSGVDIQNHLSCFPQNIKNKAYEETLQYLLLERQGVISPCITSIFWADDTALHFEKRYIENLKRDIILFENLMLPKEIAINKWKKYYGMDSNNTKLLNDLYQIKKENLISKISLNEEQNKHIPGAFINNECIESFKELNIFL